MKSNLHIVMNPKPKTVVNGIITDRVPVNDRGFHYGDGVFETIAVVDGGPRHWERHMRRLQNGCQRLGFPRRPDPRMLAEEAARLCNGRERAVLKIIITRGPSLRGYAPRGVGEPTRVVSLSPWPEYPDGYAREGVPVRFCTTRLSRHPGLAGIKHLNRLEQVLARGEWGDECAEGLMSDERGHVVEGTMSNLFLVRRGAILTPDLSESGVAGIMREVVMERAHSLDIPVTTARVNRKRLQEADELFLTNSLIGIWPIRELEAKAYSVGEITRKLQQALAG